MNKEYYVIKTENNKFVHITLDERFDEYVVDEVYLDVSHCRNIIFDEIDKANEVFNAIKNNSTYDFSPTYNENSVKVKEVIKVRINFSFEEIK